jgi:hypothetical protein
VIIVLVILMLRRRLSADDRIRRTAEAMMAETA